MRTDQKKTPNKTIDQKIAALKRKKRKIQQEQAIILMKKLKQIFGKEYSPELVYVLTSKTWHTANDQEKEVWRSNAHPFYQRSHDKTIQTREEDPQQAPGTSTKEVSAND